MLLALFKERAEETAQWGTVGVFSQVLQVVFPIPIMPMTPTINQVNQHVNNFFFCFFIYRMIETLHDDMLCVVL